MPGLTGVFVRSPMTLGGPALARVAVAIGIAALAVTLAEQRRELGREPAGRLTAPGFGETILGPAAGVQRHVAARLETVERSPDELFGQVGEADDSLDRRDAAKPFALEPVEQLEQLVLAGDVATGPVA